MHGARATNLALEECDLLIALGARFDDRATGKVAAFCPNAKVVHVDIDQAELDKIKAAHVGVVGDLAEVLERLLPLVSAAERQPWRRRVDELRRRWPQILLGEQDPCTHFGLIRAVGEALDGEAVIATDVGQHQMWVAQSYPLTRPRGWLTSGGLGTMGFGMPAAIGAALAEPERTVVCFTGDGSIQMNIQELATAAEEGVNLKILLMDNQALGLVHQQQNLFYDQNIFASRFKGAPDFVAIARGYGIEAIDLGATEEPAAALREALARPGPCLIRVEIDRDRMVYPMVPPGGANRDMLGE